MKIPIILVAISLIVFYVIVPMLIWIFARKSQIGKTITIIFSIVFIVILFLGITSMITFEKDFAVIDIDFSAKWCDKSINCSLRDIDKIDFLINVIMLIPIGLIVIYFNNKTIINKFVILIIVSVLSGVILETTQFVLPVYRSVQLSDVLLNTISVLVGGCMGMLYDKILLIKKKK